jgi:glycosyltransferase involved in cell wall biosynthesis/predicted SAM-dependent methyltransferase
LYQINLPFNVDGKVLEVGCGDIPLRHDVNWRTMDMRKLPTVDIVTDLEGDWPIESETYDGVFGKFVIEHMSWRAIPHFASECFRVLKEGGSVMMVGPNTLEQCKEIVRRNRITIDENAMIFGGQEERGWNEHKAAFSPDYAKEIFLKAGFDKVEIEPWPIAQTDMSIKAWKMKKSKPTVIMDSRKQGVNIGSFTVMTKSTPETRWINLDILDLNQYASQNGLDFIQSDASKKLPFLDCTVDFIITSHFMEHISRGEGKNFLKECFRIMKPGGIIRITIPDTKKIIGTYPNIKNTFTENEGVKDAEDDAEALWNFLTAGHKTAYDSVSMIMKLNVAGFLSVSEYGYGISGSPEIQADTEDMYPDHSIYIEAQKPITRKELLAMPVEDRRPILERAANELAKVNNHLKIGLMSTQFFGCPPKGYSGLEMVVWDLACGLAELGHTVRLFAPEGSQAPPNGELITTGPALNTVGVDWVKAEQDQWNQFVLPHIDDLDIIHGNNWFGFEYAAKQNPKYKVCHTHHGHLNPEWWLKSKPPFKLNFIGISDFMKREYEAAGIPATFAYNGIDLSRYPYQEKKGDWLLFVGRLDSFKQPHVAIQIARDLGMKIHVVGGTFVNDVAYKDSIVAMAGDNVVIHADAFHEEKVMLMQNARCLLFPSKMGEPFGLVAAEAMACGTPVVALNDGAISEVVKHEDTGFICADIDEMKLGISRLDHIKPENCRKRVKTLFSRRTMAERYVQIYQQILNGEEW